MSELDNLWNEYNRLESEQKAIGQLKNDIGEKIALLACPVKVGDIMTRTYEHWRWSKKQEMRTQRARVVEIRFCPWSRAKPYSLIGIRIKKDNTDGAHIQLNSHDKWEKEEAA